jgi:hypothetical protein
MLVTMERGVKPMSNGAHHVQPGGQPEGYSDLGPTVVTVNFGLKARHIMMAFTFAAGLLGTGSLAGYLFIPAKQQDMTIMQQVVAELRGEVKGTQEATTRLVAAVEGLQNAVDRLRETPPRVIVRQGRQAPSRGKPAGKPSAGVLVF